jgi:hypothetical protein
MYIYHVISPGIGTAGGQWHFGKDEQLTLQLAHISGRAGTSVPVNAVFFKAGNWRDFILVLLSCIAVALPAPFLASSKIRKAVRLQIMSSSSISMTGGTGRAWNMYQN